MMHGAIGSGTAVVVRDGSRPPEMNVFDHLRVIFKYRRMILVICSLAAGITGVICYFAPPTYTADACVVPPPQSLQGQNALGLGMLGGTEAMLLRRVMDVTSVAGMYVGILESRAVLDAIVRRFDLISTPEARGSATRARKKLRARTGIEVSDEGIVYITVRDDDRHRAAALANAYVEELDRQNKRLSTGQATGKRVFLETRLQEVEQKLSRIDDILSRDVRVQEMLYEMLVREYEIAKIEEAKSLPTIQVLDAAVPPEVRDARGTIRKAALAGIVALVGTIFLAFGREYVAECRRRESMSTTAIAPQVRSEGGAVQDEKRDRDGSSVEEGRTRSNEHHPEAVGVARPR
jgi:uncharacterized protein involved in exopolysaccharide biosynthesis